jgi:hypothetical protein
VFGPLNIPNNSTVFLSGVISNSGTLAIQAAGNGTELEIANGTVLAGGGVVNLGTNANGVLAGISSANILTNLNNTISGAGQLGDANMGLVNFGTIDANVAGQSLTIRPTATLIVTNYGLMRASNGGILELTFGTYFNAGTVEARTNSTVQFASTAALLNYTSGTLSGGVWRVLGTNASTVLDIGSANPITNNLASVELGGPGVTFSEIDTIVTNQGTFKLSGGDEFVTITNLINSGTVVVTDPGSSLMVTGFLANTGTVLLSNSAILVVNAPWTNSGVLNLQGGVLSGAPVSNTGLVEGNGTVNPNLTDQGTVAVSSGTLDIVGALIAGNGVNTTGAVSVTGGDLVLSSSVTTLGSSGVGSMVVSSGVVSANNLAVGSQAGSRGMLVIAGGLVNVTSNLLVGVSNSANGAVQVTGGSLYVTNAIDTASLVVGQGGNGSYTQGGGTVTVNRLVVTNGANSTFTFNSGTLISGGTSVTNGQLFAVGDGTDSATYELFGGVHSFSKNLEIRNNGTLSGCGTVTGNVVVDPGGTVLANCGGTLTFTGIVTNNGTMRAINGSVLEAYGTLVNNGTIDAINGSTNFHGAFINNGTVLTASSVQITSIARAGQNIVVLLPSVTNHTFQLQFSGSLTPPSWLDTGASQSGNNSILSFTDSGGATNLPTRFYRVECTSP